MAHKKKQRAGVTIKTEWVERNGFGNIFKGAHATSSGNLVIDSTDFNLDDHSFVEVEFSPQSASGRWIRMLIPRTEVEAIVVFGSPNDARLIGFSKHPTS